MNLHLRRPGAANAAADAKLVSAKPSSALMIVAVLAATCALLACSKDSVREEGAVDALSDTTDDDAVAAEDTALADATDVTDTADDADAADVHDEQATTDAADEPDLPPVVEPRPYPDAADWGPNAGPGVPARTFTEEELWQNCAYLDGGEKDLTDHHNLVTMYDGYLLMPWAPEWGGGGLTFFDLTDPCAPTVVGSGFSQQMRETHSIGFSHMGGSWAVVNGIEGIFDGGIQFWDISDRSAPAAVADLHMPDFVYPDAYAFLTLSVFWQAPYVYVANANNGIAIVDASDPTQPVLVHTMNFDPVIRTGQIQAIGNLLIVTGAETPDTILLDISDPAAPVEIPGGRFEVRSADDEVRDFYFSNSTGGFIYYARKESGGGVIIYDIHDPSAPQYAGEFHSDGNGAYVFVHEGFAFTGESNFGAVYDVRDHNNITEVNRMQLEGDLDTLTPLGHLTVVAVDDDASPNQGSAIAPWRSDPDTNPPEVTFLWPPDGADDLAITSRFGLTFSEFVDVRSAFEGSVRLYETGTDSALTRVDGYVSAQETIVNFWPAAPLRADTAYTLEIPAGGITDFSGNAIAEPFFAHFRTAP